MDGLPDAIGKGAPVRRWPRAIVRAMLVCLLAGCVWPLTACQNFFQCQKASCPDSGDGTGNATDVAYVAYTGANGTASVVGYNVAGGVLTAVVANVTLPFVPVALAVAPSNDFLYVASLPGGTGPGIYAYSISATGALSSANGGAALATDTVGAMAISPDGNYLYTLSSLGQVMTQYSVNTTTGALSSAGAATVPSLSCALAPTTPVTQTCSVAVSPNEDYVVASLGTGGDVVFPYSSSSGISQTGLQRIAPLSSSGDFSVAIDASDNAYIAQTTSMTVYGLASTAITNRGTVSYASGSVPRSVIVGPSSKAVYTANVGASAIGGYLTGTTTALSILTGAPFTGPASVSSLGVDNTGSYLVAAGYDTSTGLQLYSIATTGVLASIASAGTTSAKTYPVLVAMTH